MNENQTPLIKVEYEYNKEDHLAFMRFGMFRYRFNKPTFWLNMILTFVVYPFLAILSILMTESSLMHLYGYLLLILVFYSALRLSYIWSIKIGRIYDKKMSGGHQKEIFEFMEDGIRNITDSTLGHQDEFRNYVGLLKSYETKNYIFLFNRPGLAYIIRKSAVTLGSTLELRVLLQMKLGSKYIIV